MAELFEPLWDVLPAIFTLVNVAAMVGGVVMGIVVGALPGLTATMSIAILLPLSFGMEPLVALGLMAGIYNGSMYGGAIPAVLLRIPGTPAAIVTTFDGYPMAQRGEAGKALQIALISSALGGMWSAVFLMLLAPPLSLVTLAFGPPEVFWIGLFGMTAVSVFLGDDIWKGLLSAAIGLFIGVIGLDPVTSHDRFTFGFLELETGVNVIVLMVGLYALPPCFEMGETVLSTSVREVKLRFAKIRDTIREMLSFTKIWLWAGVYGVIVGILPGASGSFVSFLAYARARRMSKSPETFGKGNPEGIAASEFGNNADNAAALIPTITLGIPGSTVATVIMGGLLVHGLQPGPQLFREHPDVVYGFMVQMLLTSAIMIPLGGAFATNLFAQVLRLPRALLLGMILALSVIGVYSVQNSFFDVYLMFVFGLLGYVMERTQIPIAPAALGLILGPLIEKNLRISLLIGLGDWRILFTRPISATLAVLIALVILFPFAKKRWARRRAAKEGT